MKRLVSLILAFGFLSSCGKNNVEYLYDKYDTQNYQAAMAAFSEKCRNEHKIFTNLDQTSNFSSFFTNKVERIFKIHRKKSTDGGTEQDHYIYVRIDKQDFDSANKTMKLHIVDSEGGISSTDLEHRYKTVLYKQQDNKSILETISTGVCSNEKGMYTQVGSWNNESLTFSDSREVKVPNKDEYTKMSETFIALTGYPLIFFRWNGTISYEQKIGGVTKKYSYKMTGNDSIKEISNADCQADTICQNVFQTLQTCSLVVDKLHYKATSPESEMTSFANCSLK